MKSTRIKNKNKVDEKNKAKFLSREETVSAGKNTKEVLEKSNTSKSASQKSKKSIKNKEKINQSVLKQKEKVDTTTASLVSYKKKDLSDINYFVPKKNNEKCDQKTIEAAINNVSIKETYQNLEPPKSCWRKSNENLENDMKQIMIQEKIQRSVDICENPDVRVSRTKNDCNETSGGNLKYRNKNHQDYQFRIPTSPNQNNRYANLIYKSKHDIRNSTNNNNLPYSSEETPYGNYSLEEFIVKTNRSKEKSKIKDAIRQIENPWRQFYLADEQLHPPDSVEAWLQTNETCLDQIINEEKNKSKHVKEKSSLNICNQKGSRRKNSHVNPNKTYAESCLDNSSQKSELSLDAITLDEQTPHRERKQRSESEHDNHQPPKNFHMLSKKYSLDYIENDSETFDHWLQDNQIVLDQIIIEEKIKRKHVNKKPNLDNCEEKSYARRENSLVNPNKTYAESCYDISSQKSELSLDAITLDEQTPHRERKQRSESEHNYQPKNFHMLSKKYSLDYIENENIKRKLVKEKPNLDICEKGTYAQSKNLLVNPNITYAESCLDNSSQKSKLTPEKQTQKLHQEHLKRSQSYQDQIYKQEEDRYTPFKRNSLNCHNYDSKIYDQWIPWNQIYFEQEINNKPAKGHDKTVYRMKHNSETSSTENQPTELKMPSRRYSIDYFLQNDNDSSTSDQWFRDNQICLDQIIIEEKIKKKVNRSKNHSETSSDDVSHRPKEWFSVREVTRMPDLISCLLREFQLYNISVRNVPYSLTKLDTSSKEFNDVYTLFFKSMHSHKIQCIKKVINPYMLLHYNLRKAFFKGTEKTLSTAPKSKMSILYVPIILIGD